jgi:hypothetical protein
VYLEIDEGFIAHRKTLRFCGMMQDPNAFAYMLRLWSWATRSAPKGDLRGMAPADIEIVVQYRIMDDKCFRAMVTAGFIDTDADGMPTEIHNWMKRTGGSIARMEKAAQSSRERKERWRERQGNGDGTEKERVPERQGNADEDALERSGDAPRQDKTSPVQSRSGSDLPPPAHDPGTTTVPQEPYGLMQLFGRLWKGRYDEPWIRDQWDPKAADSFIEAIRGLSPPDQDTSFAAIPGAIARYLASDNEFYRQRRHPFQLFAKDFNVLRKGQKKEPQMIGKQKIADLPVA